MAEAAGSSRSPLHLIFRYALCAYLHALQWIHVGGDRAARKLATDLVDVAFATYATSFDGFLSDDQFAMSIYKNARFLLDKGFLREELMPKFEYVVHNPSYIRIEAMLLNEGHQPSRRKISF